MKNNKVYMNTYMKRLRFPKADTGAGSSNEARHKQRSRTKSSEFYNDKNGDLDFIAQRKTLRERKYFMKHVGSVCSEKSTYGTPNHSSFDL